MEAEYAESGREVVVVPKWEGEGEGVMEVKSHSVSSRPLEKIFRGWVKVPTPRLPGVFEKACCWVECAGERLDILLLKLPISE